MAQAGHAYTTPKPLLSLLSQVVGIPIAWITETSITVAQPGAFLSDEHQERLRDTVAYSNLKSLIASGRIVAHKVVNGTVFTLPTGHQEPQPKAQEEPSTADDEKIIYVAPYMRRDGVMVNGHYKRPRQSNGLLETEPRQTISIRVTGANGKSRRIDLEI